MKTLMFFLMTLSFFSAYATEKAHVHGVATVSMAIEDFKKGEVIFDIPAESVFGFEHEAKTKKDKMAISSALKKIELNALDLVRFPEFKRCSVKNIKVEIEKEEKHSSEKEHKGHHADVSGRYEFECMTDLNEAKIKLGLFKILPKLKKISLQILSNEKQMKKDFSSVKDEVELQLK